MLSTLRAMEMSRLLRETELTVVQAGQAVGWGSRSQARAAFAAAVGLTPSEYRRQVRGRNMDVSGRDPVELTR